ncbi:MAG: hypothetical protein LQ345_003026 [Seirophora villosa]|nr:MAG: hypothetical protein LQ345_003026 [Seirophora villosa]
MVLSPTISAAAGLASGMRLNKHFYIPRAVSSMFTGRVDLLDNLRSCLLDASTPAEKKHTQKRFVIHGLGGLGKTEFCCKFAQDNRQRQSILGASLQESTNDSNSFWGIFWINASSRLSVQHTYATIAQVGGVEPNERAAKNWLANLDRPWLLLIDNADDLGTPLEEHFPEGDQGIILVTTRNPLARVHGTVGKGSYHFERLGESEANDLLLRAAGEPAPWSSAVREYASKITNHLGFLALAVLQAGKAIAKRICTLSNYVEVYDRSWQRVRRLRRKSDQRTGTELTVNMNVYSSYEIIFRGLEATDSLVTQDAVQLIKTFAFFSWEDLRIDVLTTSVQHPRRQSQHDQEEVAKSAMTRHVIPQSWTQIANGLALWAAMALQKDQSGQVLPAGYAVLRDDNEDFDEDRLMDALDQLNQLSLIYYQEATESYTMHPLIHTWVRERPQMSTSEQALWCQAAITTLSRSILLPPLDEIPSAESLRRHLVPHVSHALRYQKNVEESILENLKMRKSPWLITKSGFGRNQALASAKFSLIYLKNGCFTEAERLQVWTRDFVCARLGLEYGPARKITLLLAVTYGLQMRTNEAAMLQEEVLEACKTHLGPHHHKTLKVMSTLGASRRLQGRFREGRALLEQAIEGMSATLRPEHGDTLQAMDDLGRLVWMYVEYVEARKLHTKVVDGLTRILGPVHERTLIAKENLAMACLSFTGEVLLNGSTAHGIMEEVLQERKERLGKEHPWTLYAICNLARIKSGLGNHIEAERMMRDALPIAQRNLGLIIMVLVRQGRLDEAEDLFNDVIQRQRFESSARDDGEHPDRIAYLWYLVQCYQKHGKVGEASRTCDELIEAVSTIGGQGLGLLHPFAKQLHERREELRSLEGESSKQVESSRGMVAA